MKTMVSNIKTLSLLRGNATTSAKPTTQKGKSLKFGDPRPLLGNAKTFAKLQTRKDKGLKI